MFRKIAIFGVIGGVIVATPMLVMTFAMPGAMEHGGMLLGYTIMLVALSMVFLGVKSQRDNELGGVIRFWPALGMGLAISVVAGLFYVGAWEICMSTMQGDFIGEWAKSEIAQRRAAGMSAADLAKFTAQMDALRANYANPLYRMTMTFFMEIFPVGVIVSLVSAGSLCFPRFLPARRTQPA